MKFSTFFLVPLLAAHYVAAHGLLRRLSIEGKVFEGNHIGSNNPSVIRAVNSQDPNKGANNPVLTCGPGASPASLVADALPGNVITFDWETANDKPWPHNTGSMLTYMASCGSVTCDKFNQGDAQWFKIDQVGRKPNSGEWFQNDLFNGGVATVRIPQNIAPGNYLIRHEIIALHLATNRGGAEFYPACAQLRIGGTGTGVPRASDLVKIPGAYSDDDPGIFDPSVFDSNAPYVFPGPPIATFVAQGSPSTPPSPSSSLPPSSPSVSPDVPQPPQPSPQTCRKKKKNPTSSSIPESEPTRTLVAAGEAGGNSTPTPTPTPAPGTGYSDYRPRRLGHVMRRIAFENSFH